MNNHFGVKVNDAVIELFSGCFDKISGERNALPDSSLVARVPISLHDSPISLLANGFRGVVSMITDPLCRSSRTTERYRASEFCCQETVRLSAPSCCRIGRSLPC